MAFVGPKRALLHQVPPWVIPGSSADLWFQQNVAWSGDGVRSPNYYITGTRASTEYAQWADGHYSSFASGVPAITDLGWQIYQAATNLQVQSNNPATTWSTSNASAANGALTGPDNVASSAGSITDNTSNTQHGIGTTSAGGVDYTNGTTYTFSGFFFPGTATVVQLTLGNTGGVFSGLGYANFSLSGAGSKTTGGTLAGSGIAALGNGWYRVWITATATASANTFALINLTGNNTSLGRNGSYIGTTQTLYMWGVQIEASAFPTPPILTTTTSATRAADVWNLTGPAATAAMNAKAALYQTNAANLNGTIQLLSFTGGDGLFYTSTTNVRASDGTNSANGVIGSSGTISGSVKSAFGLDATSMTVIANGGAKGTQSTSTWPSQATGTVYIGNRSAGDRALNGFLRRLTFGPVKGQFDGLTN